MNRYEFKVSRVFGDGSAVFPDEIIIDRMNRLVIHRKPMVIGSKETKIHYDTIASVSCNKHMLFADIHIETRGGREIIVRGFSRDDADRIMELLSF